MKSRFAALAVSLVLASFSTACGRSMPPAFPLEWKGVSSSPTPSARVKAGIAGKKFRMEAVVDKRADRSKIGIDEDSSYEYRTTSSVSNFTTERLHSMFNAAGIRLVEGGEFIIQSEIGEFTVLEGGTFNGEVRVTFRVFAPGAPAFEALYTGTSKRWGRSHSPENINESLSNSLHSATDQFLNDDAFADFLEGKAPAGAESAEKAEESAEPEAKAEAAEEPKKPADSKKPAKKK